MEDSPYANEVVENINRLRMRQSMTAHTMITKHVAVLSLQKHFRVCCEGLPPSAVVDMIQVFHARVDVRLRSKRIAGRVWIKAGLANTHEHTQTTMRL